MSPLPEVDMIEPAVQAPAQGSNDTGSRFMQVLTTPAVDKTIAIVASLPFVYAVYHRLALGTLNIPSACAAISQLIVIATMVLRRAPQRITPNPLWWLLAFVATYGALFWSVFAPRGRPIVPDALTNAISLVSFVIVVYARWSLGRNIGFVPAQRTVVRSGAYAYVRHPIYAGLFLAWLSLALRLYSSANVAILLTIYALIVIKSIVEEGFLRQDPEYAEYMRLVKYRFIPGLV
jgi:protein-S-isoprenylcysteine O-methyltransferase Ste14